MTESDWLTSNDMTAMLEQVRGLVSQRKLRLLVCAYRRLHWERLTEPTRRAVELAEDFVEGLVSRIDLNTVERDPAPFDWDQDGTGAAWQALRGTADAVATTGARGEAAEQVGHSPETTMEAGGCWDAVYSRTLLLEYHEEQRIQAGLLREVVGNPFQLVRIDPAWLAWDDAAVVKIARSIYDERRFEEMTVLADALEEAGCACPPILEHCRQPREHVRGCWLLDRLLRRD